MSHHPNRPRHHQGQKKNQKQQQKKGLHKDWRTWTVVILMLAAIAAYVLTDDEALGPGGQPQEAMEAVGE
jgi:hypothetical protein